jgi:hypothetical protein
LTHPVLMRRDSLIDLIAIDGSGAPLNW